MAKKGKAMEEEMVEVAPAVIEAPVVAQETPEQRDQRLAREDYARRNLQAIAEREAILRRNKVIAPDEIFTMDPDAAVNQRCCF
jgi:hypothetical protein